MQKQIMMVLAAACVAGATSGAAQEADKLTIHGYLTQAYAITDGPTLLGIPGTGTTDYRTAALQFRYAVSNSDNVTLQLSHRRLGRDIATSGEAPVQLDWAFYGHRFGNFDVRIGRAPIPSGIYNEVRDVGVLLPFYRAPFNFYLEGSFTSETVDGVTASYETPNTAGFGFEATAFAGGWDMNERTVSQSSGAVIVNHTRVEKGIGAQVWLRTPLEGVRIGAGGSRYEADPSSLLPGTWKEWHASFDARRSRATLQSEYRRMITPDIDYNAWYVYAGVRPVSHLTLHAQVDRAGLVTGGLSRFDFNNDNALGASWAFRSNLVLKAEGHSADSFWTDSPTVRIGVDGPTKVRYYIISLSTSF